jgi:hypothetical protein
MAVSAVLCAKCTALLELDVLCFFRSLSKCEMDETSFCKLWLKITLSVGGGQIVVHLDSVTRTESSPRGCGGRVVKLSKRGKTVSCLPWQALHARGRRKRKTRAQATFMLGIST